MKNLKKSTLIITILSFLSLFTSAKAEIKVVASIKPIHSLASYLMDGVAKPDLIVDGYSSPHGFALKPSHAKMLQEADLIFWVGEDLENFMEKPLDSIAKKAEKIELMEIKGLNKLKFRERNIFGDHDDHDDHGHKEDGHKKDDHDDHDHKKKDGHDDHDDHDHKKKTVIKKTTTMIMTIKRKMGMTIMMTMDIKRKMTMMTTMIMQDMKVTTTVSMTHIFG